MNTYVLLYEKYAELEITNACYLMSLGSKIITFSVNDRIIKMDDGRSIIVDKILEDIDPDEIDVLLIPGGRSTNNERLSKLIAEINQKGKLIAAICGGVDYLCYAGILENRRYTGFYNNYTFNDQPETGTFTEEPIEIDNNIITAHPDAYIDFAIELGKAADIFNKIKSSTEEFRDFLYNFKNIK